MEKRLHQLETIEASGDDGQHYVVHGYEHLARVIGGTDFVDQWEPVGVAEYKLSDGRRVTVDAHGAMWIDGAGIKLVRDNAARSH